MNIFSRLDPDIMHAHILPRLDGTTLTALSLVSHEFCHLICNNTEDLWRNICTSKWPSLLKDPIVHNVISTFPGGYRSFFSDAFPSLHHLNNSHCSYPLPIDLIHALDIYIHGKPLISRVRVQSLNTNCLSSSDLFHLTLFDDLNMGHIHTEEWKEYMPKNLWTGLRLSWIVIDPIRKRAANLLRSSCKPIFVERLYWLGPGEYVIMYEMVMAGECQVPMEMVKCRVSVSCFSNADGLHLKEVVVTMENIISRNLVKLNQFVTILLNAIQNGERKKFDLPREEYVKMARGRNLA
jgi:hypothetical protein